MAKKENGSVLHDEMVTNKIHFIRGQKVMLDSDLGELYGVETKRLKEQVKRNSKRFPDDFMFQITEKEFEILRSQIATSSWGGKRYLPLAFTEQGVAMLSSVLNSERAIAVNIQIIRIFTKMRSVLLAHKDILLKLEQVERKMLKQDEKNEKFEKEIQVIFKALKQLLNPPQPEREQIGYKKS
jgi:hypothetical protein